MPRLGAVKMTNRGAGGGGVCMGCIGRKKRGRWTDKWDEAEKKGVRDREKG